jgi:hypothetical protein
MHTYRAVSLVSGRLGHAPVELTDGILAAVFTLSYSEVRKTPFSDQHYLTVSQLLRNNHRARGIHVAGLAEMVRLRTGNSSMALPKWFRDFLVQYVPVPLLVSSRPRLTGPVTRLAQSLSRRIATTLELQWR